MTCKSAPTGVARPVLQNGRVVRFVNVDIDQRKGKLGLQTLQGMRACIYTPATAVLL